MSGRAKYWRRLVTAWEKSGLSQAEFCRRRDIKPVNFGWWKRGLTAATDQERLRRPGRCRGRGCVGFVESGLNRPSARSRFDRLVLSCGSPQLDLNPCGMGLAMMFPFMLAALGFAKLHRRR